MIDVKKYKNTIKKSGHKIKDIDYIKEELYTDFLPLRRGKQQIVRYKPLLSKIEIYFTDGMCLHFPTFTEYYY